jgi:hypothetical protein
MNHEEGFGVACEALIQIETICRVLSIEPLVDGTPRTERKKAIHFRHPAQLES